MKRMRDYEAVIFWLTIVVILCLGLLALEAWGQGTHLVTVLRPSQLPLSSAAAIRACTADGRCSFGSGVVVWRDEHRVWLITAADVVRGDVTKIDVVLGGTTIAARRIADRNARVGLAVIETPPHAQGSAVEFRDGCFPAGTPVYLAGCKTGTSAVIRAGRATGAARLGSGEVPGYTHTAPAVPGDSGGPLFDGQGRLIGIQQFGDRAYCPAVVREYLAVVYDAVYGAASAGAGEAGATGGSAARGTDAARSDDGASPAPPPATSIPVPPPATEKPSEGPPAPLDDGRAAMNFAAILERLERIEREVGELRWAVAAARPGPAGRPGRDGADGEDGQDGADAEVDYQRIVEAVIARLPAPKPAPIPLATIKEIVADEVARKPCPPPEIDYQRLAAEVAKRRPALPQKPAEWPRPEKPQQTQTPAKGPVYFEIVPKKGE